MLPALTPRSGAPWGHLLQRLGGRLGDTQEVRRNNSFASVQTIEPFFISYGMESRSRTARSSSVPISISLVQRLRMDLYDFWLHTAKPLSFDLNFKYMYVFPLKYFLGGVFFIMSLSGIGT